MDIDYNHSSQYDQQDLNLLKLKLKPFMNEGIE